MATEQRLIDANALIRRLCEERDDVKIEHACDIGYHNGLNMAVSMTINNPTVDAVEVVRCKDCKNGRQPWLEGQTMVKCMVGKTMLVTPEHFCSYGERRTDNDNK